MLGVAGLLAGCGTDGWTDRDPGAAAVLAEEMARVVVADPGASARHHVTATPAVSAEFLSVGGEGGVSVDRAGTVYMANFHTSVWTVTAGGEVGLLSDAFDAASGNTVLPNGSLLQADFGTHEVYEVAADGRRTPVVTEGLDGPVGVAVGGDGSIYVANCLGGYVARVAPGRKRAETFVGDGRFGCPNGLTIDADGNLYLADLETSVVFRITPDGELSEHADLGGPGNGHLAFARGGLYVTQLMAHRVVRLGPDGRQEVVAGTGAKGFTNGPEGVSTVSHPNGIAAAPDGGSLWFNTHAGVMAGGNRGRILLRRLRLPGG